LKSRRIGSEAGCEQENQTDDADRHVGKHRHGREDGQVFKNGFLRERGISGHRA
jgi:hypothetical protein